MLVTVGPTCPNCGSSCVRRDGEPATSRFAAETLIAPFACHCGHKFLQSVRSLAELLSLPTQIAPQPEPEVWPATPSGKRASKRRPRRNKIRRPVAAD